ncbi:cardiolipin synthase ClsB [Roseateles oligotrophus]|uniref:Cardiolipin synthase B n=1 Tax=Roseateles oligotrophus TaxID=1769250 RepID=A0ABT2YJF6_9BURK|nr:cardiolipin synthase ClsB [Roseateles oligotrophus]MCV2370207.1 cardiolipin synthase ClsB [Roseateles oligotrophus]
MSKSPDLDSLRAWAGVPQPEFFGGNELRLLRGGDELFPAQAAAIASGRHEIWLATYIFHFDAAGAALAAQLVAAARRGLRVRVVVDGFGSRASLPWLNQQFEGSGVALAVFRPIDRWYSWLQPGQLRRLHQKLCVVDGDHAFVGGINIIGDCVDLNHGATEQPRLDFAVGVSGPLVMAVAQAARAVWTRAYLGGDFGQELLALARSSEPRARLKRLWRGVRMPRSAGKPRRRGAQSQQELSPGLNPVYAAFVLRDNLRRRRTIERAYVDAIRSAQKRVDLMTPYFYPGHAFRKALRDAARRGVQVRLLLQGKLDYRIAGMAAQALYAELLGHGVLIYEYTPAYLHAKVCVVDEKWATVGSSNIDPLSLLLNLEANVIVRDAEFARAVAKQFDAAALLSRQVDRQYLGGGLRAVLRRALVAWAAYVYLRVAGATGRY